MSFNDVHNLIKSHHPDIIINLVALTNVDLCEADPSLAYLVNTKIPSTL